MTCSSSWTSACVACSSRHSDVRAPAGSSCSIQQQWKAQQASSDTSLLAWHMHLCITLVLLYYSVAEVLLAIVRSAPACASSAATGGTQQWDNTLGTADSCLQVGNMLLPATRRRQVASKRAALASQ
jgi:hypothetical protein